MLTRLIALAGAAALAVSLLMSPTPASAGSKAGYVIGGIAAGALIGGAIANANRPYYAPGYYAPPPPAYYAPPPPAYYAPPSDAVAYCMQRYRSYRPETGTFIGYDGIERPCP
jgi:hypothetical protein